MATTQESPNAAALSLKSPQSLSVENSSLYTSPQNFRQPLTGSDQMNQADSRPDQTNTRSGSELDEGDNSNAFAVALDPVMAPAEDSALFYSGKIILSFSNLRPLFLPKEAQ